MMNKKSIDELLKILIAYMVQYNMAHFGDNTEEMKVVCFEDVQNHLKQVASSKYDVMISQYVTLLNFLVSEETLKSSQKLSFEIMNVGEYKQDLRRFLSLNTFPLDDTQLLVMHVKNVIARPEKSLTEEIIACYDVRINWSK